MLLIAIGRWPYGYYMLLRVIVSATALLLTGSIYQRAKVLAVWGWLFLVVAIIFNPIVPLQLTRGVWSVLNVLAAAFFVGHFLIGRSGSIRQVRRVTRQKQS